MTTTYKGFTLVAMKGFKPSAGLYTINHDGKEKYVIEKVPGGGYISYRNAIFIQFPKQADRLARCEYEEAIINLLERTITVTQERNNRKRKKKEM